MTLGEAVLEDAAGEILLDHRGFRINHGVIPPSLSPTALSQIPVEVSQASASLVKSSLSRTSVGRWVTRVVVRAG